MVGLAVRIVKRFLADRGTQLSAMIAYYALISFVPLTFLALAAFGLLDRPDAESELVERLHEILPGAPVDKIVDSLGGIQDASRTFGLIGALLLVWSSLGLFNALQTAFNVVYRRPHRSFAAGRGMGAAALLLVIVTGVVLFLTVSVASGIAGQLLPAVTSLAGVSFVVSFATGVTGTFVVLGVIYFTLTNASLTWREVLPGAALGAVAIQVTFQVVPLFLRLTSDSLAVQMLGSTVLLLLWFYVLALIVVFCAEINWGLKRGGTASFPADRESSKWIPDRDNP
jgi:membrane protein